MAKITVDIPKESKDYLGLIQHEDAAANQSQAVQWCIDSCMKIEKLYGVDACYIAHTNIVLDTLINPDKEGMKLFNVKFYDDKEVLVVKAATFPMAGIVATAHRMLDKGAGVLPGSWPLPFDNVPCGYAGGLSCENLVQQIGLIEDKVGERSIWIDVETKVRSNDDQQFDLGLVKTFLEIAGTHMKAGIIPQRGVVILTEAEQDFATHVGYEVALKDGGTGINMGLYFPETWAEDGILKANGVNVFFPEKNAIYVQNFNQVELIFPNGITRMNPSETLYGFMSWLTTREQQLCLLGRDDAAYVPPLIEHFIKVNNLPRVRENWTEFLIGMSEADKTEARTGEGSIPVDDSVFMAWDLWLFSNGMEYSEGNWYHKDDKDGETVVSMSDLFKQFRKETIG